MIADEVESNPECREGFQDEDGSGLFVFALDEFDGVEDEGFEAVDGGSKPEYFSGHAHAVAEGIYFFDFA